MPIRRFESGRAVEIINPPHYGSGYRIGGRLVLTAKHLVSDGVGSCQVRDKRTFEKKNAKVVWAAPSGDIALVELPEAVDSCEPVVFGRLPSEPLARKVNFDLYGWPEWAQTTRPGEVAKAGGRHITGKIYLADTSPEGLLVVEPERVPKDPRPDARDSEWAGISGAAVVCNGLVVAVQFHHQNPGRAASLEATLLSKVYDDPTWRDLIERHGIPTEPEDVIQLREKQDEDYCNRVTGIITSKLKALDSSLLKRVAQEIRELAGEDVSGINLKSDEETLAEQTAACIVSYSGVTDIIGRLVGLMQDMDREDADRVANIVDYVLPLNYAPDVIRRLREQLSQGELGIVTDAVATKTLAEIIMAGHDQSQAKYIDVSKSKTNDVPGLTALDYQEDPNEGPVSLSRVRNMFRELAALHECVLGLEVERDLRDRGSELSDSELVQEIEGYVKDLEAAIETTPELNGGRRLYCIMNPPKDEHRHSARLQVLKEVAKRVPDLLFVELVERGKADKQELKTRNYIVARLVRMQSVR